MAAFSAVAASEANYGVGVQVKIHPPRGAILSGPLTESQKHLKTSRKKMQITKKISEKI